MARGGRAWRGWFPFEGELTSGRADRKEGIYFGEELPPTTRGSRAARRCTARTCSPPRCPSCATRCSRSSTP